MIISIRDCWRFPNTYRSIVDIDWVPRDIKALFSCVMPALQTACPAGNNWLVTPARTLHTYSSPDLMKQIHKCVMLQYLCPLWDWIAFSGSPAYTFKLCPMVLRDCLVLPSIPATRHISFTYRSSEFLPIGTVENQLRLALFFQISAVQSSKTHSSTLLLWVISVCSIYFKWSFSQSELWKF